MQTIGDVADAAMHKLVREQRTELNRLATPVDANAETLVLEHAPEGVLPGQLIGVDDEVCYVHRVDAPSHTLGVYRAAMGDAVAHADGARVMIAARFFPYEALADTIAEVHDCSERLFSVTTLQLDGQACDAWFDLDGLPAGVEVYRVLQVRTQLDGNRTRRWRSAHGALQRDLPTDEFPSGYALELLAPLPVAGTVRVSVAHSVPTAGIGRDTTLASLGLPEYAADAFVFGAAYRLLGARDATASDRFAQGASRRDEEVLPRSALQTAEWFRLQRDRLLGLAEQRLLAQYHWRH